jgi:hypothetical protein
MDNLTLEPGDVPWVPAMFRGKENSGTIRLKLFLLYTNT